VDLAFWAMFFGLIANTDSGVVFAIILIVLTVVNILLLAGTYILATMRKENVFSFKALLPGKK